MQNIYESQPFQIIRQVNNYSPSVRSTVGLRERNDFNNLSNVSRPSDRQKEPTPRLMLTEKISFP